MVQNVDIMVKMGVLFFQNFWGDHPKNKGIFRQDFEKRPRKIYKVLFMRFSMINLQKIGKVLLVRALRFSTFCISKFSSRPPQIMQKVPSVLFDYFKFFEKTTPNRAKSTFSTFWFSNFSKRPPQIALYNLLYVRIYTKYKLVEHALCVYTPYGIHPLYGIHPPYGI